MNMTAAAFYQFFLIYSPSSLSLIISIINLKPCDCFLDKENGHFHTFFRSKEGLLEITEDTSLFYFHYLG